MLEILLDDGFEFENNLQNTDPIRPQINDVALCYERNKTLRTTHGA